MKVFHANSISHICLKKYLDANKGEWQMAQDKLDELRAKRIGNYVDETPAANRNDMLERIWKERRKELYGEGYS